MDDLQIRQVLVRLKKAVKALPDPSVTLVGKKWRDPYLVLVSCLLSLRTKDETTLPASGRLFALADAPEEMVKIPVRDIERAIYPVGFYRTKARRILDISRVLIRQYQGKVPDTLQELLTFKGVGRKTANVVRSVAWGYPAIAVDTHVFRVANRLKLAVGTTPLEVEKGLMKAIPKKDWSAAHHWLIWHGRRVCTARKPACETCFLQDICPSCTVGKK